MRFRLAKNPTKTKKPLDVILTFNNLGVFFECGKQLIRKDVVVAQGIH